jgi:hypothetical protein
MDTKFFGTGLSNRLRIHNVTTQDTKYLSHRGNLWRIQDTVGWMLTIKQADGQSLPIAHPIANKPFLCLLGLNRTDRASSGKD